MNVRHLVPSVSRPLPLLGSLILAAGLQPLVRAQDIDFSKFKVLVAAQYIAALADPEATSGNGAEAWGLWDKDPGPRGCKLELYPELKETVGDAKCIFNGF